MKSVTVPRMFSTDVSNEIPLAGIDVSSPLAPCCIRVCALATTMFPSLSVVR
jgi:hypothetical protein